MEIAEGAAALKAAGDTGTNVVLVSMGYVNTRMHMRNGDFPALIDQVLKAAGDRTVVWPTLGRTSDCTATYVQAIGQANELLAAAKAKAPNLVLIDYPAFIDAHPEYSQHRCPHLTDRRLPGQIGVAGQRGASRRRDSARADVADAG